MIDLHCHLLPGLDDGAKTLETSYAMAQAATAVGVQQIVCTPHCIAGDPAMGQRITHIRKAVEALNDVFAEKQWPMKFHAGMELLCNEYLPWMLERGDVLTLAGSRYLLIEFRFDVPISRIEWAASQVRQAGYIPVLAHPERYTAVWRNLDCLAVWFYDGYVLQLDKDSVLGRFGSRCTQTANWVLRHGLAHVIASDAHDTRTRTTNLEEVRRYVAQQYSPWYAKLLVSQNPARIVQGRELVRAGQE